MRRKEFCLVCGIISAWMIIEASYDAGVLTGKENSELGKESVDLPVDDSEPDSTSDTDESDD